MPAFWLKRQILMNLPSENLEMHVANSIDFMVERVSHRHLYSPYCHVASIPRNCTKN